MTTKDRRPWEHKFLSVPPVRPLRPADLDAMATDGWEVVTIVIPPNDPTRANVVLRRKRASAASKPKGRRARRAGLRKAGRR